LAMAAAPPNTSEIFAMDAFSLTHPGRQRLYIPPV